MPHKEVSDVWMCNSFIPKKGCKTEEANDHTVLLKQKVHSDVVGSRNVSGEKVLDLRDVHGLFDGGVSPADLKEAALQRVLTDHHSEKHSHLIIPKIQRHTSAHSKRNTANINAFASIRTLNCTLLCIQLLHWCRQSVEIPRPYRDLSLHHLLQQPFTHLQSN